MDCAGIDARRVQFGNKSMSSQLLAIDDADLHLSIVCKIATQVGFVTTGANSVSQAARLLHERTFDCITLDLSLGEQSGIEILKLLAEMKCRTPIIVVSGSGNAICAETIGIGNFLDLNLCPPIPKPIHLAVLRSALTQIAHDTQRQHQLATAGSC
jgi:two-component system, chemotaxis family, chemotaxis protein CheY